MATWEAARTCAKQGTTALLSVASVLIIAGFAVMGATLELADPLAHNSTGVNGTDALNATAAAANSTAPTCAQFSLAPPERPIFGSLCPWAPWPYRVLSFGLVIGPVAAVALWPVLSLRAVTACGRCVRPLAAVATNRHADSCVRAVTTQRLICHVHRSPCVVPRRSGDLRSTRGAPHPPPPPPPPVAGHLRSSAAYSSSPPSPSRCSPTRASLAARSSRPCASGDAIP